MTTGLSVAERGGQRNEILTRIALGRTPESRAGCLIFPIAPVELMAGNKVVEFDGSEFAEYDSSHSPGEEYTEVKRGHATRPVALNFHGFITKVNDDLNREQTIAGIGDDNKDAAQFLMNILGLDHERKCARVATDIANYNTNYEVLVGTDKWSDRASDIIKKHEDIKGRIRRKIGKYPNSALYSAQAFEALKSHPQFSRMTDNGGRVIVTERTLEQEFGFQRVEVGLATSLGADGEYYDVWGNDVWMGYTDPRALRRMANQARNWFNSVTRPLPGVALTPVNPRQRRAPSFGYTYMIEGHPWMPSRYREEARDNWVYKIKADLGIERTGMDAGFLLADVT
ncbi:MAG: hypothetical protein AAGA60_22905 [Cyanobacteria bacterium P01_E01_bin.42]